MADELAVAALVRKRAELAGRVVHARAELDGLLAGLAALDATLRLFDPGIRVRSTKVSRGGFSAVFLVQCLKAMGVKSLSLEG